MVPRYHTPSDGDHNTDDDDDDNDDDRMVGNATRKAKKLQMGKSHSTPKEAFYNAAREMLLAKSKKFASKNNVILSNLRLFNFKRNIECETALTSQFQTLYIFGNASMPWSWS